MRLRDLRFLYRLTWEPSVRAGSFGKGPSPWGHFWWFTGRLGLPFWDIILVGEQRVGMVRCDVGKTEAVMSIAISKGWRKCGLGVRVLRYVSQVWGLAIRPPLVAYVRVDNRPSRVAFSRAGYRQVGELTIKGYEAWRLEYV